MKNLAEQQFMAENLSVVLFFLVKNLSAARFGEESCRAAVFGGESFSGILFGEESCGTAVYGGESFSGVLFGEESQRCSFW